jgi:hypothetical protein
MVHLASTLVAGLAGLASVASAHPGHDVKAEAAERAAYLKHAPKHARSLNQCADKLRARGHERQNVARRAQMVDNLRRSKGLQTRTFAPPPPGLSKAIDSTNHTKAPPSSRPETSTPS